MKTWPAWPTSACTPCSIAGRKRPGSRSATARSRASTRTSASSRRSSPPKAPHLYGYFAIGHNRYSTTGSSVQRNAQPFLIETRHGPLATAHNGNLVNTYQLRSELLERGVGLSSSSDSEVITMMLAGAEGDTWEDRIRNTMPKWRGAYSLVILVRDGVFAVRDPWGFRPLSVGRLKSGGHAAASESCALRTIGCEAIREVEPGEVIRLSNNALRVLQAMPPAPKQARCTFEHIYFSRPDSVWDGRSIHHVRQRLGEALAAEAPVEADVVIPVPDSAIPAAIGYSQASGIPFNDGLHQEPLHRPDLHRTHRQPAPAGRSA